MGFNFETLIDELNEKNFNLTLENESLKALFSEYYDLCKILEADGILKIKEVDGMERFIEYKNNKYIIYKEGDI